MFEDLIRDSIMEHLVVELAKKGYTAVYKDGIVTVEKGQSHVSISYSGSGIDVGGIWTQFVKSADDPKLGKELGVAFKEQKAEVREAEVTTLAEHLGYKYEVSDWAAWGVHFSENFSIPLDDPELVTKVLNKVEQEFALAEKGYNNISDVVENLPLNITVKVTKDPRDQEAH